MPTSAKAASAGVITRFSTRRANSLFIWKKVACSSPLASRAPSQVHQAQQAVRLHAAQQSQAPGPAAPERRASPEGRTKAAAGSVIGDALELVPPPLRRPRFSDCAPSIARHSAVTPSLSGCAAGCFSPGTAAQSMTPGRGKETGGTGPVISGRGMAIGRS